MTNKTLLLAFQLAAAVTLIAAMPSASHTAHLHDDHDASYTQPHEEVSESGYWTGTLRVAFARKSLHCAMHLEAGLSVACPALLCCRKRPESRLRKSVWKDTAVPKQWRLEGLVVQAIRQLLQLRLLVATVHRALKGGQALLQDRP